MRFDDYQKRAKETDRLGAQRQNPLTVALYGLAGETGSLHTLYKKRLRDGDQFTGFGDKIKEELGDILWYLTAIATIEGLSLTDIACITWKRQILAGYPREMTIGWCASPKCYPLRMRATLNR
jgi:NTP pyrophosphatase (non-canonical NTP hydrolase)